MELKPVVPFEPVRTETLPAGPEWIAQVKWDGVRILTYYDGDMTRLINRKGNERSKQYPEFMNVSSYCRADSVILDGEMIALAGDKPSFHEVMRRDSLRREAEIRFAVKQIPTIYMIFDVLYHNGEWVTGRSLADRQELLQEMIIPSGTIQLVPSYTDGERLFAVMKERGWEGVVSKRLDSTYALGGKDGRWQKLKLGYDLYAVIGGVTYRDGVMNALLLGVYDENGQFVYIGHTGSGKLNQPAWRSLAEQISVLTVKERFFHNIPQRIKGAVWTRPLLTVKVQFMEWTPGGTMRHPVLQGMADVLPESCTVTQGI
ncbi:RNA ligase family protein [Paenibacillus woosongensis]|uniref:DNA ligase (ATP) n=1 Tax=Paenibacillus woosongensis TaxID=307580 RepID=A0AA95IE97_9BACL|nr:RNA ligase family protein [Paenibacillus woosongensis]WHX51560.1 RNA ligase family protein [Paenibacillus woosongensis]